MYQEIAGGLASWADLNKLCGFVMINKTIFYLWEKIKKEKSFQATGNFFISCEFVLFVNVQ